MLNPLSYTEKIVRSFLRYQLTTYPFADERLNAQMRQLLSLDQTRNTPLLKGPYISLSQPFSAGAQVESLIRDGILHEHMAHIIPFPSLYGHQEEAIRAIHARRTTLISTGTGSGKSECFLYPVISRCLQLRDEGAGPGICAVIVYPMNALAEDQLSRLRDLLAGSAITFGMYVGKTPDKEADVTGFRMPRNSSRADYQAKLREIQQLGQGDTVHPCEEVCSREIMRTPGKQPRILLTNVKQLELLLTRHQDVELFDNALLDFLVFDEAHTFTGAQGAESACLIRRLRSFCGRNAEHTVCIAASATIVDKDDPDAAREFAARFFGVQKDAVAAVREIYEKQHWGAVRRLPPAPYNPEQTLENVRMAVDAENYIDALSAAWKELTGDGLPRENPEDALYCALGENELLFQIAELLKTPYPLDELAKTAGDIAGRPVGESEILVWLILGAMAQRNGRPLVRPVVHAFIRGIPGAVVTFDSESGEPVLHLSAGIESSDGMGICMRVSTCTTCGQHYFEHFLEDFSYTGKTPGGGNVAGDEVCWETEDEARGGVRVLLSDRIISEEDDDGDEDDGGATMPSNTSPLYICPSCGAAHSLDGPRCRACGKKGKRIRLLAMRQKKELPGKLSRCICCAAFGRHIAGPFREPARPVRAVNVADVHVLSQDMIHHAQRKRLLVFADNRQDAAFQAGWMRDHARRFRLRSLMASQISAGQVSIGDLAARLDRIMEQDKTLSMALLPEVWAVQPLESAGEEHRRERRYLLRIHVLHELTTAMKQQIGLEPWGRIRINYKGLEESASFIQQWARKLKIPGDELLGGVAAFLDLMRRRKTLFDSQGQVFGKIWAPGARELESGYLPLMRGVPRGLKLAREATDDKARIDQWYSAGHATTASQMAAKWGVLPDDIETFLRELWAWLAAEKILMPVTLKGSRGNALPSCVGAHQVNGDHILISANASGVFRCRTCRRRTVRRTPHMKCIAWRCDGVLEHVHEDPDNYDLQLIDSDYSLLRPREHTAMVPAAERENLENIFKGDTDTVNTLVCTQTLELGVDIGALDAVLMRNVPPLPANYWQRAGRAGRRHRMAVNVTYCRQVNHDRAYFEEPVKMLAGRVEPPRFNMANPLMVAKHVRAAALTTLHQLAREKSGLNETDRSEISDTLKKAFPTWVKSYFFDSLDNLRSRPSDISALHTVVTKHSDTLGENVLKAFTQRWPADSASVVEKEALFQHINELTEELQAAIGRVHRRLKWATSQMEQLEMIRRRQGDLDDEQKSFYERCFRFVSKLKRTGRRRRREAEGVDDTLTFSVLAAEGFLPGYGLETGSVVGMAEVPKWVVGLDDFDLPRPAAVAVREYVPGNLIYANGQRFVPRRFTWEAGEAHRDAMQFEVHIKRGAVVPVQAAGGFAGPVVTSMPVCDVTLVHQSRISDEEENRFQMGVAVYGRELGRWSGGRAYSWGPRDVLFRKAVHIQLVNVGTPFLMKSRSRYGYPVCGVCGQSISPFSSDTQDADFRKKHRDLCGREPGSMAFHADLVVDALSLPDCEDTTEAYSMIEAIRFAAWQLLDMDLEDLQVLVIGRADSDNPTALLYDPMPGGSGLLEQIVARFGEIIITASQLAGNCASACTSSCIDCFRTYRNAFYHEFLDRHCMIERIEQWGDSLVFSNDIPPRQPSRTPAPDERPVNEAERKLKRMLCKAGLPDGAWQLQRDLPRPLGSTTPDITFDDPDEESRKIFVYLDGLSEHIHGNAHTRQIDAQIRAELQAEGHDVIVITAVDLDDERVMTRHLKRLARVLISREAAQKLDRESGEWFTENTGDAAACGTILPFRKIDSASADQMWNTCVPLYSLRAAAGAFSAGHIPEPEGWAEIEAKKLCKTMFVAQVSGKSMEPRIPDGSWCLFDSSVIGSRNNRILVVQHRDISDPDTGGAYTIKKYRRAPQDESSGEGLKGKIVLLPENAAYTPIEIDAENEDEIRVVAELVRVLE